MDEYLKRLAELPDIIPQEPDADGNILVLSSNEERLCTVYAGEYRDGLAHLLDKGKELYWDVVLAHKKLEIAYNPEPFGKGFDGDESEKVAIQGGIFAVFLRSLAADLEAIGQETAPNYHGYTLTLEKDTGLRVEVTAVRPGCKSPSERLDEALTEVDRLKKELALALS